MFFSSLREITIAAAHSLDNGEYLEHTFLNLWKLDTCMQIKSKSTMINLARQLTYKSDKSMSSVEPNVFFPLKNLTKLIVLEQWNV